MMSVTSWSSLVGFVPWPHVLNQILSIECFNGYDRRPRLHPRLLTLHLSFMEAHLRLRNTLVGGSPLFHGSRNRFSFARQVQPPPLRTAAQLSSSPSPHGVTVSLPPLCFCYPFSDSPSPLLSSPVRNTQAPPQGSLFRTWQLDAHAAETTRQQSLVQGSLSSMLERGQDEVQ